MEVQILSRIYMYNSDFINIIPWIWSGADCYVKSGFNIQVFISW